MLRPVLTLFVIPRSVVQGAGMKAKFTKALTNVESHCSGVPEFNLHHIGSADRETRRAHA